ncbi:MAG TPA: HAD-IIIA family hydrolase [Beutenbergiaceae bacterium]|nr:HAD-IIIA family hydrolase [Beutenbergiaceae bacterium]
MRNDHATEEEVVASLPQPPRAVLFDRDDTLITNVPYNADPDLVTPIQGARRALDLLRAQGLKLGVVTNQSGVAKGLITAAQVRQVNKRVEHILGPFDTWQVCPHGPEQGCSCRKPKPGMVLAAAVELGVPPDRCVLVGDIGSDMAAASSAGAHGILVPTSATFTHEIEEAAEVAGTLSDAVHRVLDRSRR